MAAFIKGFLLGFSLILAIGAQNAFVIRQGLRNAHVLAVCLTCAVSDAILIAVGVAGFGRIAEAAPWITPVFRWGGAAFLLVYGVMSLRSAWQGGQAMGDEGDVTQSVFRAVLTSLAFTWLNPHVYLDTLVLVGSVAASLGEGRLAFGAGAVTASFVFFFSLGYGARRLAPAFRSPRAWRALDAGVGLLLLVLAAILAFGA
ncbi:MAG: LysE/ArgO family amino acid transporter [Pseudomonadota bacterium]